MGRVATPHPAFITQYKPTQYGRWIVHRSIFFFLIFSLVLVMSDQKGTFQNPENTYTSRDSPWLARLIIILYYNTKNIFIICSNV